MKPKPIKNYYDYKVAKDYIDNLNSNKSKLNEDDQVISTLLEDYERRLDMDKDSLIIEPVIDSVFDSVKKASKYERDGLLERCLKLGEEYGELSAEILKTIGYKRSTESKEKIRENILLESSDCMIMIFDIMIQMGFTKKEISDMSDRQINKWLKTIEVIK